MTELLTENPPRQEAAYTEQQARQASEIRQLCPYCGTHRIARRSRFRWFDLPLLVAFVRPVRCTDCYSRYYRFIRGAGRRF